MTKILSPLFTKTILASVLLLPVTVLADNTKITIVNHFDKTMSFVITINPKVLPDLSENFTLAPNDQITTQVLDMQKEAYIHGDDGTDNSTFWGIKVEKSQAKFHGYISKGIAFSWNTQMIVFCTPEEYKKHNTCLR